MTNLSGLTLVNGGSLVPGGLLRPDQLLRKPTSSFSPADISNLAAWFKADDAASITSSGGAVSQWNDKSAGANHATQGTSTFRPITGTRTINGKNALDFDGLEDHFILPSGLYNISNSANTTFIVYQTDATGDAFQRPLIGTNGTGRWAVGSISSTTIAMINSGTGTTGGASLSLAWDTTARLVIGTRSGTSQSVYRDGGTPSTNTNATDLVMTSLTIGNTNTSGNRFNGLIAEIIVYSKLLTASEINQVGNYLQAEWGLTYTAVS